VEWFTGRRWNGAEWSRVELAKSGPKSSRCVVGSGFRRLIGGRGLAGVALPHLSKEQAQRQARRVNLGPVVLEPVAAAGRAQ
jgi:hypothetical protein